MGVVVYAVVLLLLLLFMLMLLLLLLLLYTTSVRLTVPQNRELLILHRVVTTSGSQLEDRAFEYPLRHRPLNSIGCCHVKH